VTASIVDIHIRHMGVASTEVVDGETATS
jgi:hypothetical protein